MWSSKPLNVEEIELRCNNRCIDRIYRHELECFVESSDAPYLLTFVPSRGSEMSLVPRGGHLPVSFDTNYTTPLGKTVTGETLIEVICSLCR